MNGGVISGKTSICGVIGDPIEHTMSPAMHNSAFVALGLDYIYVPFKVKGLELRKAIEGIRGLNIRGINVTIPHKVSIMQFLDRIDSLAEKIGAVNTIVNDSGILSGYNTDASGFFQALCDINIEPKGKKVLLLGAGGAARAIAFILLEKKASVTILNRKEELQWAEGLARRLMQHYGVTIDARELTHANLQKDLVDADILVNATSAGMSPNSGLSPVPADLLSSRLVVFDIIYNPFQTRLLREAREAGATTIDGLEMLVWQGTLAFEKWTGQKAPVDIMRQAALEMLGKMKSNIALIGFMGTGKTTIGKFLAERLKRRLIETDSLIERMAGKSISDIFKTEGEIRFRELEIEAIKNIAGGKQLLIVCGGGVVLNTINIDRLRNTSVIVNLAASPSTILHRTSEDVTIRPLLKVNDPELRVKELIKYRKPFYDRAADFSVNTSKLSIEVMVDKIIDRLKNYEGFNL